MKSSSYVIIFIKTHAESCPSSGEREETGAGLVQNRVLREDTLPMQKKKKKKLHMNISLDQLLALRTTLIRCGIVLISVCDVIVFISVQSWIHFLPRSSIDDVRHSLQSKSS